MRGVSAGHRGPASLLQRDALDRRVPITHPRIPPGTAHRCEMAVQLTPRLMWLVEICRDLVTLWTSSHQTSFSI